MVGTGAPKRFEVASMAAGGLVWQGRNVPRNPEGCEEATICCQAKTPNCTGYVLGANSFDDPTKAGLKKLPEF